MHLLRHKPGALAQAAPVADDARRCLVVALAQRIICRELGGQDSFTRKELEDVLDKKLSRHDELIDLMSEGEQKFRVPQKVKRGLGRPSKRNPLRYVRGPRWKCEGQLVRESHSARFLAVASLSSASSSVVTWILRRRSMRT